MLGILAWSACPLTSALADGNNIIVAGKGYSEQIAITATDVTSTQTSAVIDKPKDARGLVVLVKVSAGSGLLLDVNILIRSPGADSNTNWVLDCFSDGITGVNTWGCAYVPDGVAAAYTILRKNVMIPNQFTIQVSHGNATECSYVVYYQWLW
jgi:hypothetical protein